MKKYLIASCLTLIVSLALVVSFSPAHSAAFDPFRGSNNTSLCDQKDAQGNPSPVCSASGSENPITGKQGVVTRIANIFSLITGVAAVVVIMVSGFEYVRSSGDAAKTNKAKNGILFALIGLVVVALARAVVALMVSKL